MYQIIKNFRNISSYSRVSLNESRLRSYLVYHFKALWFDSKIDEAWNLVVYVPAKNSTSKNTVIIQSQLDMVCVKGKKSDIDFINEAVDYFVKNDKIYSKQTSLWLSSWIAISIMMNLVELESHPNLELLFTVSKEKWLIWSQILDRQMLSWNTLINLNHHFENEIVTSGTTATLIDFSKKFELAKITEKKYILNISNLSGWNTFITNKLNILKNVENFISTTKNIKNIYSILSIWDYITLPNDFEMIFSSDDISKLKNELWDFIWKQIIKYDESDLSFKIGNYIDSLDVNFDFVNILNWFTLKLENANISNFEYNKWVFSWKIAIKDENNSLKTEADLKKFFDENEFNYNFYEKSTNFELKNTDFIADILKILPEYKTAKTSNICELGNLQSENISKIISIWCEIINIDSIFEEVRFESIQKLNKDLENILNSL